MQKGRWVVAAALVIALVLPAGAAQALPKDVTARVRDVWHEIDYMTKMASMRFTAVFHNGSSTKSVKIQCTFVGGNSALDQWSGKIITARVRPGDTLHMGITMDGPFSGGSDWRVGRRGCEVLHGG
jgi:hypothetical protein